VQIGTPRDIYERPSDRFVADFVGTTNFIDAVVVSMDGGGRCRVRTALGELNVECVERPTANDAVVVSVRPEDVGLSERAQEGSEGDNFCTGVVYAKAFLGDCLDFQVKIGDFTLLARVHPSLRTPVGDRIYVRMRAEKCVAVADRRGQRDKV
jgi:iron(III) transport system ATP-binding protein